MTSVHYSYAQTAANEFSTLFDGERVFSHPKPVNDIKSLIAYLSNTDDLIVDFLLAQAHLGIQFLQNAKDHVNRRFILVQLPEPFNHKNKEQEIAYNFCERMGTPKNIAEITKERLRRAGKRLVKIIQTGMVTLGSVYLNLTHPIFGLGKQQRKAFHYNLMPI